MSDKLTVEDGYGDKLNALCRKRNVSRRGLMTGICKILLAETDELGFIEVNWREMRKRYPTQNNRNIRRWKKVVDAVREMLKETTDPEEMAMRSRFTLAQIKQALVEIENG